MKYIEILDSKSSCEDCFFDGEIVSYKSISSNQKLMSWNWAPQLEYFTQPVEIMSLYSEAESVLRSCPQVKKAEQKLEAHRKAIKVARVDSDVCVHELIPPPIHKASYDARHAAAKKVANGRIRTASYDITVKAEKITKEIEQNQLQLKIENITSPKQVSLVKKRFDRILYDIGGSVTGRLTTKKGSFPILTLSRKERGFVVPTNDLLIEMDFNAAELRVFLALSGQKQPDADVHTWNRDNVFVDLPSREEAKERFFAWLYNANATDVRLQAVYDKNILEDFYKGGKITTPFKRSILVDHRRALNYLIQSTASDLGVEQAYKVRKLLRGKKTFIKALIHDSILLDVAKEDVGVLKDLYVAFKCTRFGEFMVNIRTGKDFYKMEKLDWKI